MRPGDQARCCCAGPDHAASLIEHPVSLPRHELACPAERFSADLNRIGISPAQGWLARELAVRLGWAARALRVGAVDDR